MKIKKAIQTEVEFEIETPAFLKKHSTMSAIYDEDHTLTITVIDDYVNICRSTCRNLYRAEEIVTWDRITEEEFNEQLSTALSLIANSTGILCSTTPVPEPELI